MVNELLAGVGNHYYNISFAKTVGLECAVYFSALCNCSLTQSNDTVNIDRKKIRAITTLTENKQKKCDVKLSELKDDIYYNTLNQTLYEGNTEDIMYFYQNYSPSNFNQDDISIFWKKAVLDKRKGRNAMSKTQQTAGEKPRIGEQEVRRAAERLSR